MVSSGDLYSVLGHLFFNSPQYGGGGVLLLPTDMAEGCLEPFEALHSLCSYDIDFSLLLSVIEPLIQFVSLP